MLNIPQKSERNNCIGMFGTCGNSTFRQELFIPTYERMGLVEGKDYYNPQVAPGTWDPSMADIEAWHLANDKIILFPILASTYGLGSLSEVGFSLLNAIDLNDRRFFVTYIEPEVDDELVSEDKNLAKASNRARSLIISHLNETELDGLYIVDRLEHMLELSIELWGVSTKLNYLREKY